MDSYKKQMQRIARKYEQATGRTTYAASEVARWAIDNGLWKAPAKVLIKRCADDLSSALREEYITDSQNRRVRSKHAALVKKGGEQISIWADIRTAPRSHMVTAFHQRRKQIVGDCKQLKTDVDSYNDNYNPGEQIPLILNFTDDVHEAELIEEAKKTSANGHSQPSSQSPDAVPGSALPPSPSRP